MSSLSFSYVEGQIKRKQTRREKFLSQMDELPPWKDLQKPISRYYSKSARGRRSYSLSSMLHIHCMQFFYNLNDPVIVDHYQ